MDTLAPPRVRKLRGYAIDPSLSTALLTLQTNQLVYEIDWETLDASTQDSKDNLTIETLYVEYVEYCVQ